MLATTIKPILAALPEMTELVKKANLAEDYPVGSKDDCLASALTISYHKTHTGKGVDLHELEKVAHAVKVYGLQETVKTAEMKLVKQAQDKVLAKANEVPYHVKEASLGLISDVKELSKTASDLYEQAVQAKITPSDEVVRYSGHAVMDKVAAVRALANRYQETKDVSFVKIARALHSRDVLTFKPETVRDVCVTVSELDKTAGYRGVDFFKEALLLKTAASIMTVKIDNKDYPYEKIHALGKDRIGSYIGKDFASCIDKGPHEVKSVFETLPLDSQKMLAQLLANA